MKIDRTQFFNDIRKVFGRLTQDQVDRINIILDKHDRGEEPKPPAPINEKLFERTVREYGPRLMRDLDLTPLQAAAVFGNLGHETGGFTKLQEQNPTVKGSKGGWGWAQWTGPRRRSFEAWADKHGLDRSAPETNYRYLLEEARGTEKRAFSYLRRWTGNVMDDLRPATKKFEEDFERAGVKHYPSRYAYADRAWNVLKDVDMPSSMPSKMTAAIPMPEGKVKALQAHLRELGYYTTGKVDGKWGDSTTGAISAWKHVEGILPANGETLSASEEDKLWLSGPKPVAPERATTTIQDLREQGSETIKQADGVLISSRIMGVLGVLAAILAFVVENWGEASAIAETFRPMLSAVPAWAWPLVVVAIAVYNFYKARTVQLTRVADERAGVHNGEPVPVGTPPSEAWSDTPKPKPAIGAVVLDVISGGLLGFLTGGPAGAAIGAARGGMGHIRRE